MGKMGNGEWERWEMESLEMESWEMERWERGRKRGNLKAVQDDNKENSVAVTDESN